jgi:hypothetical protein
MKPITEYVNLLQYKAASLVVEVNTIKSRKDHAATKNA